MQKLPETFLEWFDSLKVVKANGGPANGSIATALVVLNRLKEQFSLSLSEHLAARGTQIKGASGKAVADILRSFGEVRPFAKEGGRTNRGGPSEIKELLLALQRTSLPNLPRHEQIAQLEAMQLFLVDQVKAFHNRQKIKYYFNPSNTTWSSIRGLLDLAAAENKSGPVAQHLVGAKLQIRFPDQTIPNNSYSTADIQTNRPGDFFLGDTAFHVTVAPMTGVFEKCLQNIREGIKPYLLVPGAKLEGARQIAEQYANHQISVESIESFVSQNIDEISLFHTSERKNTILELIEIYNRRVEEVEIDKSLMIELPLN